VFISCLQLVRCQNYESEYEDSEHYENEQPDYSKYYSKDTSAPLIASINTGTDGGSLSSGFVTPIEYSSFFGPSNYEFGATKQIEKTLTPNSNDFLSPYEVQSGFADYKANYPFKSVDYFEAAKQKEQPNNEDTANFKYPVPSFNNYEYQPVKSANTDEEYTRDEYKYIPTKAADFENNEKESDKDNAEYNSYNIDEVHPGPSYISHKITAPGDKYPAVVAQPQTPVKYEIDYKTRHPLRIVDPKYQPLPYGSEIEKPKLQPYQKYSFQPTNQHEYQIPPTSQISSSATETKPKKSKKKNCKKIVKRVGKGKEDSMECFVCENPKTGSNYEECSYGSESKPKGYYHQTSSKYEEPTVSSTYRYKRYIDDGSDDDKREVDPYEEIKARTLEYYSKPKDFEQEYYAPKDYGHEDYSLPTYYAEEKSASEKVSEEMVKSGENCKKVEENGMTCMKCNNPKTGGNYEQCFYGAKVPEKQFAYSTETKFGNDDDSSKNDDKQTESASTNDDKKLEKIQTEPEVEVERIEPVSTNKSDIEEKNAQLQKDQEEYDQSQQKSESKLEKVTDKPKFSNYYAAESKKDVAQVLAEFSKKDRSKCSKSVKNNMTCYACVDASGVKNEECMYISESAPKETWVRSHKKYDDAVPAASENVQTSSSSDESHKNNDEHKYRVEGEGGAFSHETEPVYSKQLGFSLPKFMLVKSEGEKLYDQFVKG